MTATVQTRGLTVRRDRNTVLADVSFQLGAGRTLAVVGPNGAGKTSLLLGLLGLLPTTGDVLIANEQMAGLSRLQLARLVAFVPQSYDGFGGFTVRATIEMARYAHTRGRRATADDLAACADALAACDLTELAARPLDSLSAGQRQRALLAAAIAQASPVLLLDEPTANLDPAHQVAFVALLRRLQAERGLTLVVVSHDLNLPAQLDAEVLAIVAGHVKFHGHWQTFATPASLCSVFGVEFEVLTTAAGRPVIVPIESARPPPPR